MKYIFSILLFLPAMTQAQTITKDTIYCVQTTASGTGRIVTNKVSFQGGQIRYFPSNEIDTSTARDYVENMITGKFGDMAQSAQKLFSIPNIVKPLINGESTLKDSLEVDESMPYYLEEKYKTLFVFNDWSFNAGSPTAATVQEDGTTGVLEITISATDYQLIPAHPDCIIMKNYPSSGSHLVLFRLYPGINQFRDTGQTISLSR
jgi:hypothetical protein